MDSLLKTITHVTTFLNLWLNTVYQDLVDFVQIPCVHNVFQFDETVDSD